MPGPGKIALACQWGHPGSPRASHPRGALTRRGSRNKQAGLAPPGKERPLAHAENFRTPLCPTDIIALSKCGFVVVIFTGGRRPGRDNHGEWIRLLTPTAGWAILKPPKRFRDGWGRQSNSWPTTGTIDDTPNIQTPSQAKHGLEGDLL